jgi:uncharacterized repeat protein (TIGR01451 family)
MNTAPFFKKLIIGSTLLAAVVLFSVAIPAFAAQPTVTTSDAASVTGTTAVVSGTYNVGATTPGGATPSFDWGPTPSLEYHVALPIDSKSSDTFTATISGLTPGVKYFFRATAFSTVTGPGYGVVKNFTTPVAVTPSVMTMGSDAIATAATLRGFFNANGGTGTETKFIWGTTSSNLNRSTTFRAQSVSSGPYTDNISGLSPFTKYYFQAVVRNFDGVNYKTIYAGEILSFTTGGSTGTSCTIDRFDTGTYPTTVASGGSTMLYWMATGCTSASIDQGIGNLSNYTSGNISTGPLTTSKTFTLTASDGTRTVTSPILITVTGTSTDTDCAISSFYPSPSTVVNGASTTLYWTMTSGCTSAWIDNGVGAITAGGTGQTSSRSIFSGKSFTLTATDRYGVQTTRSTYVSVNYDTSSSCSITSYTVSPSTISRGQSATLSWYTYGCTGVSISGGSFYGQVQPLSGTLSTGALSGTTTFTLYANGTTSTSQQQTVYVTDSPYPYQYQCQNGGYSDPSCQGQYAGSIITTLASNIGSTSVRLNGMSTTNGIGARTYFEYGTTAALGQQTVAQYLPSTSFYNFYDTIATAPNTLYYYRAVGMIGATIIRGNIISFQTPGTTTYIPQGGDTTINRVVYVGGSSANPAATSGISVIISSDRNLVRIGDTVTYSITYQNATSKSITNAVLNVVLPQGSNAISTTQGTIINPTMITAALGTIVPNQSNTITIRAMIGQNSVLGQPLIATGTLSYTLANGQSDSTIGTTISTADFSQNTALGGYAFGTGFFPNSAMGWIIIILIILGLVIVTRTITRKTPGASATHDTHSNHH